MGKSGKTQKNFYLGSLSKGHTAFEKTQNLDADAKQRIIFTAPATLEKNNLKYWLEKKYQNFYLYAHHYNNGVWYECFDKHDLRVIERYGNC